MWSLKGALTESQDHLELLLKASETTRNTKTRLFSKAFILDTVLGDSPHILCGFATVKWTEWNVLTPKPHWRKASPHSSAFRKRPWLTKSERQSDRKVICRLSLPVAYEMWFMETDLDWRIRTCPEATHAEENRTEAVCTRKIWNGEKIVYFCSRRQSKSKLLRAIINWIVRKALFQKHAKHLHLQTQTHFKCKRTDSRSLFRLRSWTAFS